MCSPVLVYSSGCAVVIHAGIGGGKTSTARAIADILRDRGFSVRGILSMRLSSGVSEGYDAEDLETGEVYPLVRLTSSVESIDWETYGNPIYSFSCSGFARVNNTLRVAAEKMAPGVIVFLDEYGKLELRGEGIRPGVNAVVSSLGQGGAAVVLCRSNVVPEVEALLRRAVNAVGIFEAGDVEAVINFLVD
jgi:nucleoside-triphosphatase THEP1